MPMANVKMTITKAINTPRISVMSLVLKSRTKKRTAADGVLRFLSLPTGWNWGA
jgi:hypothetical protein